MSELFFGNAVNLKNSGNNANIFINIMQIMMNRI